MRPAVVWVALLLIGLSSKLALAETGFTLRDLEGDHLDVLLDGKLAGRYMYAYDKSSKQALELTYKPYLHVFNAEGNALITKGPGGEFTHHRGIFIGWMTITYNGKKYDRWHMKGGEIVHQKFTQQKADADSAIFTSLTHWNDEKGAPMLVEERTMRFSRGPAPFRLQIDFTSRLQAPGGEVKLDGDPEHAGIQYRPANEVDRAKTIYYIPVPNPKPHKDLDYPWAGETYTLGDKQYSVVELSHPDDPKGTRWSLYRDYGRFGAFPVATIPAGGERTFKYRFLVADGEMPPAEVIQKSYDQFTGAHEPSPVPAVTKLPAEHAQPTAPKAK